MSWSQKLTKPIIPLKGPPIRTLGEARSFILNLPKKRHADDDVNAAVEALLMAAEGRGPILHATVGVGRVAARPVASLAPSKKTHWGKRPNQSPWR